MKTGKRQTLHMKTLSQRKQTVTHIHTPLPYPGGGSQVHVFANTPSMLTAVVRGFHSVSRSILG
jgi:hypothetical protein